MSQSPRRTIKSTFSFAETEAKLATAIDGRGLKTFAVVDHGAGAASIGETLGATKLYIFGNPKAGTPLMQAEREAGLDLPLKALVYETVDGVFVATPNIDAIAESHGIDGLAQLRANVANALASITAEATGQGM